MSEIDARRGSFSRRDFLAQAAAMLIVSGVDIGSAFVPAESRLLSMAAPTAAPTEAAPVITTRPWSMPAKVGTYRGWAINATHEFSSLSSFIAGGAGRWRVWVYRDEPAAEPIELDVIDGSPETLEATAIAWIDARLSSGLPS